MASFFSKLFKNIEPKDPVLENKEKIIICPGCFEDTTLTELEQNQYRCPGCNTLIEVKDKPQKMD